MTITNHVLTGALITKFLPLPIALPLAFISHFALDAMPHFSIPGYERPEIKKKYKRFLYTILTIDCLCAAALSIWLLVAGHPFWLLGGLIAFSPDILWIYRFIFKENFGRLEPPEYRNNVFVRFHIVIQKYTYMWGLAIELCVALILFTAVAF